MTTESVHLERAPERAPLQRPEPDPLFSVAERIAAWTHEFGRPATRSEWLDALQAGLIGPAE